MKTTLDFIVIGAQKAGTTSLFEYLKRHPQLSLPVGKEAPYFSHDSVRARGWDTYLEKNFSFADPRSKWGTVTPHYMFGAPYEGNSSACAGAKEGERAVPGLIRDQLPDARLIAILRDPIERARSHHLMLRLAGAEARSFDEAAADLLKPQALDSARRRPVETDAYIVLGEYGRILAGYLDMFRREQILILFTTELENAPREVLRQVFEFLDVAPDFVPDNLAVRYRVGTGAPRSAWLAASGWGNPSAVQRTLAQTRPARAVWHALPKGVRPRIDHAFRLAGYQIDLWNRRAEMPSDTPSPSTLHRLHEHFADDGRRLSSMLRTELPWQAVCQPRCP